ncbi:hypothetical protein HA399_16060 [Cobetia sp. UIB-001]|uniref:hypothetical protein n=1 Tax=Cobetia sp. UIB-001 TaxID=2717697 RepID=UPI0038505363
MSAALQGELGLQLLKLLISVAVVIGLSLIAERLSTRMAGLLSGYPLGTAITLGFIGVEISPEFAGQSAVYTLAGFSSTLALGVGYWLCGRAQGLRGVINGTLGGLLGWLLANLVLAQFEFTRVSGVIVTLIAIVLCMRLYRGVPESTARKSPFSWVSLLARAGLAAGIVFGITALAHLLPPAWAGLVAAFPVTMYPLLVILHLTQGPVAVATVIKHYPAGLGSLLCYALVVSLSYPGMGVGLGTLLGFIVATAWLGVFTPLQRRLASRRTASA